MPVLGPASAANRCGRGHSCPGDDETSRATPAEPVVVWGCSGPNPVIRTVANEAVIPRFSREVHLCVRRPRRIGMTEMEKISRFLFRRLQPHTGSVLCFRRQIRKSSPARSSGTASETPVRGEKPGGVPPWGRTQSAGRRVSCNLTLLERSCLFCAPGLNRSNLPSFTRHCQGENPPLGRFFTTASLLQIYGRLCSPRLSRGAIGVRSSESIVLLSRSLRLLGCGLSWGRSPRRQPGAEAPSPSPSLAGTAGERRPPLGPFRPFRPFPLRGRR